MACIGHLVALLLGLVPCPATSSLTARVWRPSAADFVYPEMDASLNKIFADDLKSREDLGFAFAGGGLRGMGLAHGAVRVLRTAGLLEKARYMSVSSGSAWFGIPLQFQTQDTLEEFMGETLPPEECTPDRLVMPDVGSFVTRMPIPKFPKNMTKVASGLLQPANDAASHLDVEDRRNFEFSHGLEQGIIDRILHCFENLCECLVNHEIPEGSLHDAWNLLAGYFTMHPYGLAKPYSRFCHATDYLRVKKRLGNWEHIYSSQDIVNKFPYLLSQSAVMAVKTGTDQKTNPLLSFYLEQTPLYEGVPHSYPAASNNTHYEGIGDLLIEPLGFNSAALESVPNASMAEMKVRSRGNLVNNGALAQWVGIATCAPAAFQIRPWHNQVPECVQTAAEKFMPHAWIWSPWNVNQQGVPITQDLPVGDAGIYDDLGHLPLLRRKVKKIVIWNAASVHDKQFGPEKIHLQEMVYLLAAFGQPGGLIPPSPAGAPNPMSPTNFLRVFEPSEFGKLWARINELFAAKRPVVIRDKFTVVDNPWFGITGGWQVEIVWVFCTPIDAWRNALPNETNVNLAAWFPNVYPLELKSHFEISALSQYGSWITEHAALPEIRAMLLGEDAAKNVDEDHVFV